MPKKCIKFIPEYLIPNLNNKTFGERLQWIDKTKKVFEMEWRHKAGPQWTEKEAEVFVEWDKHKGHFQPENKQYYTQSKQRFRALLYKLKREGQLVELPSETKYKKVFFIGQKKSKKRSKDSNVECESFYEEQTSSEDLEYKGTDDSDKSDTVKLEDHSYSMSGNFQNSFTGFLASDAENEQSVFQDTWISTLSNESSLDNLQKRVLVERNYENLLMPAMMPNFLINIPSSEFLKEKAENVTISEPAVYQCTSFPANVLADNGSNLQLNTDFLDLWLTRLDPEE